MKDFRSKGVHPTREVNRAHVFLALHQNVSEAAILQVLDISRSSLWRTPAAYNERGLDYALHDETRPGQLRKYQTDQGAEVVAPACSSPPSGRKRWTIALLTEAGRRRAKLGTINRETVRQILKKCPLNRKVAVRWRIKWQSRARKSFHLSVLCSGLRTHLEG